MTMVGSSVHIAKPAAYEGAQTRTWCGRPWVGIAAPGVAADCWTCVERAKGAAKRAARRVVGGDEREATHHPPPCCSFVAVGHAKPLTQSLAHPSESP